MGFLVNPFRFAVAPTYDADAQAYFNALDSAGYPLGTPGKTWVNNRVLNLKGIAAGSISTEAVNIWANIRLLVFYQYNAGAGNVAYAIRGGNGTDPGVPTWDSAGMVPSTALPHSLSSAIDIGIGRHTGISMNARFSVSAYQNFTTFATINGSALRHRMAASPSFEFRYTSTITFGGFAADTYDFQWTAYNLTGQSSGAAHKAKLFDGVTTDGWTNSGVTSGLPQASSSQSSISLTLNQRYKLKSFILTAQELTNAQSDNVQAILKAVS